MLLGCTVALWVGGLSSASVAKAFALVLLEAISAVAKAAVYAASQMDVGHVQFNLHCPTLLGTALLAGVAALGCCCGLLLLLLLLLCCCCWRAAFLNRQFWWFCVFLPAAADGAVT